MEKYDTMALLHFYEMMVRIRMCEESFIEPILSGEIMCPVHLCSGQEATAVGICSALEVSDVLFGGHRSHGHYLAKGASLKMLFAEVFCKEAGCSRGRGGSMHLIAPEVGMLGSAPIVGGTISLALGAALSAKIKNSRQVAVSFFGDGATGEGVLYEAMNFASLRKLPIIFVCENNLYSTHMPIEKCRIKPDIYKIAEPFEISSHVVDGNDVLAVHDVSRRAVAQCRENKGPVFIECKTYRLRGHVGPDDNIQGHHTDIRPREELMAWKKKDPIFCFKKSLSAEYGVSEEDLSAVEQGVKKEITEAFIFSKNSSYPKVSEVLRYVYK